MEFKRERVDTYLVHAMCECGGTFEREPDTVIIRDLVNPAQYWHICNKCGKRELLNRVYPTIEQEVIH
jgi:hypothetical protein